MGFSLSSTGFQVTSFKIPPHVDPIYIHLHFKSSIDGQELILIINLIYLNERLSRKPSVSTTNRPTSGTTTTVLPNSSSVSTVPNCADAGRLQWGAVSTSISSTIWHAGIGATIRRRCCPVYATTLQSSCSTRTGCSNRVLSIPTTTAHWEPESVIDRCQLFRTAWTAERFDHRIPFLDLFIKFGVIKEASRISYHEWQQSLNLVMLS